MKTIAWITAAIITAGWLAAAPLPAGAQRLAVTAPVANIRSGPGTDYDILWQVERFFPIEPIDRSGPWIFFRDFEEDRGWIHRSLVDELPAVITQAAKSNVRAGPGTEHDIRLQVESGVPFKVLDSKGPWLHVQHAEGEKGWIHRSLVW